MTESTLRQLLLDKNIPWETFQLTDAGEPSFFRHDIERFFARQAGEDISPYWD